MKYEAFMLGMGEVCSTVCMTVCVCGGGVRALGLFHLSEVLVFQLTLDLGRSKLNCRDIFQIPWTISQFKYPFSSPWSLIHRTVDCDPIIIGFPMCSFKHTHTHMITNKPGLVTLHCLGTGRVNL